LEEHHCSLSPGERTLWYPTPFGSARQPDSLSLSIRSHSLPPVLPPPGTAAATPRCTLLHQPSLRPGVFSLPGRQVRVDLGPALNRPSLQPPPDSAFTLAIPRPLSFLPFHPSSRSYILAAATAAVAAAAAAAVAAADDDFSARRRTLIPISKIRLPSKPRIDWQKHRQRAPPKATLMLLLSFSTISKISRKARKVDSSFGSLSSKHIYH